MKYFVIQIHTIENFLAYTFKKGEAKTMRKNYNPYLLPPWLRKIRFFMKHCIIPITVFQGIRTLLLPTTGDLILLIFLILISYLLATDII